MVPAYKKSRAISTYAHYVARYKTRFYSRMGFDIVMGRREGIYFWDLNGKRYINCHSNGGVFNLGHRNPDVTRALEQALGDYDIGNHHLISGPRGELARRLCESMRAGWLRGRFRESIDTVIFGVSGGEAVDLAIKLACAHTGRREVLSLVGGYHGHTGLALATGDARYRDPFHLDLPGFRQIPFGDFDHIERFITPDTAAIILETIPATLGMPVFPKATLQHLRDVTAARDIVLICDEIQTGLGRTGEAWAFQHYNIVPDIVVTGKGLSGGLYPIAATCFRKKYERIFKKDPFIHISTFGGSELACVAALKTLEISTDPLFLKQVRENGRYLESKLEPLLERFDRIVEVRGMGMFRGIVFESDVDCLAMVKALADNGVFSVYANNDRRVLQFLPPLIATRSELDEIVHLLEKSLLDQSRWKYRLLRKAIEWL